MELVEYKISYEGKTYPVVGYEPSEYISSYFAKGQFYEEPLLTALKKTLTGLQTVVDVGANVGNHSLFFRDVMKVPHVVAFEPNEDNYARLIRNTKDVVTHRVSLSDREENLVSINDPGNMGAARCVLGNGVTSKTLDSYHLNPDLLKVDAEGMEVKVLRGAFATIQRARPTIIVEHQNMQNVYETYRMMEAMTVPYRLSIFSHPTWEMFIYSPEVR